MLLLQNGARLSYALDVGYNQLAWKIRQDERVVVMERTNFAIVNLKISLKGCRILQRLMFLYFITLNFATSS